MSVQNIHNVRPSAVSAAQPPRDRRASDPSATRTDTRPRYLERRISNNRGNLDADQQLNYLFTWFTDWSPLQKEDFSKILARKTHPENHINGLCSSLTDLSVSAGGRPPSLFQCQVKLFQEWYDVWPPERAVYFIEQLKERDSEFSQHYSNVLDDEGRAAKDYFEVEDVPRATNGTREEEMSISPEPLRNDLSLIAEEPHENDAEGLSEASSLSNDGRVSAYDDRTSPDSTKQLDSDSVIEM